MSSLRDLTVNQVIRIVITTKAAPNVPNVREPVTKGITIITSSVQTGADSISAVMLKQMNSAEAAKDTFFCEFRVHINPFSRRSALIVGDQFIMARPEQQYPGITFDNQQVVSANPTQLRRSWGPSFTLTCGNFKISESWLLEEVSLRVELSSSPKIRLGGMFVWKLEDSTDDRRFAVVASATFPAVEFTITGAFQWPSVFGWKGFDAMVSVTLGIGGVSGMLLGGTFQLTMGDAVLSFGLFVPVSFPLALVMYVKMLNFDLGNMAKWYNENSGGCPSWATCISDASIQSLSSINIAHIEL